MINEIVSGFTSSPVEVSIVLGLMVVGVIALIVAAHVKNKSAQKRLDQHGEQAFQDLIRHYGVNETEVLQLRTLAEELEQPHKRYMLLRNQALFDRAAILAEESGTIDPGALSALRVRLGFAGNRAGVAPVSTSEFPKGGAVLIRPASIDQSADQAANSWQGTISRQTSEALCVSIDHTPADLDQGTDILLFYLDDTGVYRTETRIIGQSGDVLFLAQSEDLDRVQRRQFDRADVQLPVSIKETHGRADKSVRGVLLDVSAGGARVRTPGPGPRKGSEIALSLHTNTDSSLRVSGTVIRVSDNGGVLHVSFDNIKQSKQDQLYQLVLDKERRGPQP